MYVNQAKNPPVRRQKKQTKDQAATRTGKPVALTQSLHQGLRHGLHRSLYEGIQSRDNHAIAAPKMADAPATAAIASLPRPAESPSPETMVRKVGLISGESVTHTFVPEEGLIPHLRDHGRMLVLTNRRVITFGNRNGLRETVLMPVDEVKAVAVSGGVRSKLMLFQGSLIVMAGVVIYVLLAYWLEGRIDGPTVPVIGMGLVSFLLFLAVLGSVGMMAQFYFGKPDGEVAFQGDGVRLVFPFRGETAEEHIYQVVDATFAARQSVMGYPKQGYSGQGPSGQGPSGQEPSRQQTS